MDFEKRLQDFVVFLLVLAVIIFGFVIIKPTITGKITVSQQFSYSEPISLEFNQDSSYLWNLTNKGELKSLKISGTAAKNGYAKVYLLHDNNKYLIFDSTKLPGIQQITGLVIGENKTLTNETANETQQNITNENKTINLNLEYKTGTGYDANDDGIEHLIGIVDLAVENSVFSFNYSSDKLCAKYEIHSLDNNLSNIICYGSNECCAYLGLLPSSANWNDALNVYYGFYNASLNNEVYAQLVYHNLETPEIIESNIEKIDVRFRGGFVEFNDVCVETCLLNFNDNSYMLLFELNNSKINIDEISYSLSQEVNISNRAPLLLNNIPNITIIKNENSTINLSYYFYDEDNDILFYSLYEQENISSKIENNILTIIPQENFTGVRYSFVTANDSNLLAVSNVFKINVVEKLEEEKEIKQHKAIVGQPVKWSKKIILEKPEEIISINITTSAKNITINKIEDNVPVEINKEKIKIKEEPGLKSLEDYEKETKIKELQDKISLETDEDKIREIQKELTNLRGTLITGAVVKEKEKKEKKDKDIELIIEEPAQELEVSYYTDAPELTESNLTDYKKTITISSDTHYTDILAFVNISPEVNENSVKLYWLVNNSKQLVNITKYDFNNNSLVDYIEWNVPSLSNQTYELELTILNVQSYPTVGGQWTVAFTTSGTANLTITAVNDTTYGAAVPDDLEFLNLKCNDTILDTIFNGSSVFYENYNCTATGYHAVKVLTEGKHTQEFKFGDIIAYANNWAVGSAGVINFTPPTPDNNTITTNLSVQISVNVTANLSEFIWNWNNTNYTFYNDSLVLMMNFDNVSALGENDSKVGDVSKYQNNGTFPNSTTGNINYTSGKFGNAIQFDGKDDYINISHSSSLVFAANQGWAVSMWIKTTVKPTLNSDFLYSHYYGCAGGSSGEYTLGLTSEGYLYYWMRNLTPSEDSVTGVTDITDGKWHFVIGSRNSSRMSVYVDGRVNNDKANIITGSGVVCDDRIGVQTSETGSLTRYFNGAIDQVRIWNRSLSTAEIQQQYISNLKKYDTDKWNFYTNQTVTEGVGISNYTYYGYAKDVFGNSNQTETRIWSQNPIPQISFVAPTPDNNTITTNTSVQISINVTEQNLNEFKFNWNGTNYTFYNDSLVLMMNFDNVSALGENASKVVDVSRLQKNNGTISGSPVYNYTAKYGGAYVFDGVDDDINLGAGPNFTNSITMAAWVKPMGISGGIITNRLNAGGNTGYSIYYDSNYKFRMENYQSSAPRSDITSTNDYPTGQWYYVVGVDNPSGATIYINGVADGTDTTPGPSIPTGSSNLYIGRFGGGTLPFNGIIDEVRIYNRSLSASEIQQQYISNLKKYDTDKWNFYTNQTVTEGVGISNYTYYGYAKDVFGNSNQTETRIWSQNPIPQISFVAPTPDNNTITTNTSVQINISLSENNLNQFVWNWNGTNYTFYNDSLVLMMGFDNVSALGESSSSNFTADVSKYANNGNCSGMGAGCNWTEGRYAKGIVFDGVDDYISVQDSDTLTPKSMTIIGWIKKGSSNNDVRIVTKSDDLTSSREYWSYIRADNFATPRLIGLTLANPTNTNSITQESSIGINLQEWTHVAFTWNGTNNYTGINIYINGVNKSGTGSNTGTFTGLTNTNSLVRIGSEFSTPNNFFIGNMDEIRVYNRSLSATEIQQNYISTLKKYDTDKWNFYTNQTNLTEYVYSYYGYAKDNAGNENRTETRIVTAYSIPPTWYGNKTNNTNPKRNDVVQFNVTWIDNVGLSSYRFSWNDTGVWVNASNETMPGINYTAVVNMTVTATQGKVISWKFYANDTVNNWNETDTWSFTVNNTLPTIVLGTPIEGTSTNRNGSAGNELNFTFTYTDVDNTGNCSLWINMSSPNPDTNHGNNTNAISGLLSAINLSMQMADGTYKWLINCSDSVIIVNSSTRTLIINTVIPAWEIHSVETLNNASIFSGRLMNLTLNDLCRVSSGSLSNCSINISNSSTIVFYNLTNFTAGTTTSFTFNNIANLSWLGEGNYTIGYIAKNTLDTTTAEKYQFEIDNTPPSISYAGGTLTNATWYSQNWVYVNASISDLHINKVWLEWNETTNYSVVDNYYWNRTNLLDENYTFKVYANDTAGNRNETALRIVYIDASVPVIEYEASTPANNSYYNRTWIFINLTVTEPNFNNISFSLYNSSQLINQTNFTSPTYNINFTNLAMSERYYFNVSIFDRANNYNFTVLRKTTLVAPPSDKKFSVQDSSGNNILSIDDKGFAYLDGSLYQNQTIQRSLNSFTLENNSGSAKAMLNYTSVLGNPTANLYLNSTLKERTQISSVAGNNLLIKNSSDDIVAYFDSSGNLIIRGILGEGYPNP